MPVTNTILVERNAVLRASAGWMLKATLPFLNNALARRRKTFIRDQKNLRQSYRITAQTPIQPWSETVQHGIDCASRGRSNLRHALTSGSTATPKRIPFTKQRLKKIKRTSFEAIVQTVAHHDLPAPVLFVLSGTEPDGSLSGLLLETKKAPGFLDGLIMPSKFVGHHALRPFRDNFGINALRFWLMALSNPTILYATNPSTISVFLRALSEDWDAVRRLVQLTASRSWQPDPAVRKIIGRIANSGWQARLQLVAGMDHPCALGTMIPRLTCYCCWDGGYVAPFLNDIARSPLAAGLQHVPMYAMSTECIQTQTVYDQGIARHLPTAPGILYEFLPEDVPALPEHLIAPSQVKPGQSVVMVVSDAYGLRRYLTRDVFRCVAQFNELPDLQFLRRQGLSYSFTGEKVTGQQVESVIDELMSNDPALSAAGAQMTLIPALGDANAPNGIPHYRLLIAHAARAAPDLGTVDIGTVFDTLLCRQNAEFFAKLKTGRLGPTAPVFLNYDRVAKQMTPPDRHQGRSWETQFKLVPLSTRRWDEMALPEPEELQ